MIRKKFIRLFTFLSFFILLFSINTINGDKSIYIDFDPLVDIQVTVEIKQIRSLEKYDAQIPTVERIDLLSSPDFYVKIFVNDEEFTSQIWKNMRYIYDTNFSVTVDVPDDTQDVDICIQLWDWNYGEDKICDISPFNNEFPDNYEVNLIYNIKTGNWYGDDYCYYEQNSRDLSGYGRLNGCDDGSIYQSDYDCEILFDIYQNDFDNDGLPYWSEVKYYGTDPTVGNFGDPDSDGIPIIWEHKWGHFFSWHGNSYWIYNPFVWDDHENLDPDNDGLNNIQEYLLSEWGADPFRKDVFVELDMMECNANGDLICFPQDSIELLLTAFNRQNVVLHIDDGIMGGLDIIPFDDETSRDELDDIYYDYFLHRDENNFRRGVFHYGVMVYNAVGASGFVFRSDAYQISLAGMEEKLNQFPWLKYDVVFASAYMHELGHTFGFNPIPGHNEGCYYPWQIGWWFVLPYKSCMNYAYMYYTVDYSDGSRGKNDFDDWERMDLTYFQSYY